MKMEKKDEVRHGLQEKIAKKSKECQNMRQLFCERLNNGQIKKEDDICREMDLLCIQYQALGQLNGELTGINVFDWTMEKVFHEKETV